MTTTALEQITLIVSEHMNTIHASLFEAFGTEDLKEAIKHYQNESLVDNVLYGCAYEVPSSVYYAINDKRVNLDKIEVTPFIKEIEKKTKNGLKTDFVPYVSIDNGYGNIQKIDELSYFIDVYEADDKATIVASYQKRNADVLALEKAISERVAHTTKKGIATLDKAVSDATLQSEASRKVCEDILNSMPELKATWKTCLKAVNDDGNDLHTARQSFYNNVCAVIRVSIKMDAMHEASKSMIKRRTQQKSFAKLMKAAQNK